MICLDHRYFEKTAGPGVRMLGEHLAKLFGSTERIVAKERAGSITRQKAHKEISEDKYQKKYAKLQSRPKVEKSGLRRAKKTTLDDSESHSMRRAIERSKSPKKVTTEVSKSTEPIYAGGNTASNMRGVMRAEEKSFRKKMKKSFGKHSRIQKKSFY